MLRSFLVRCATAMVAGVLAAAGIVGCSGSHHQSAASSPTAGPTPADTAHASIGDLTLTGGYIPQPASPDVAAAYLTVANSGAVADTITKVTKSVTADVMAMTETDSGGVGTMTNLSSVAIPAHGRVSLTPGHSHLMLENPTRTLKPGDTVTMTITFTRAGSITLAMPVVPLTGPAMSSGNMSGMPGMGG